MSDNPSLLLLSIGFFFIAALYSSVGFGGGSSYLALLALCIPDFLQIKTAALLCNLIVVSTGSYLYYKEGLFDKKRFFPLALCSVPMAFLGATIHLTQKSFFIFLGFVLALSGILLIVQLFIKTDEKPVVSNNSWLINIGLGSSTGFLSGLVGIGGGILLSPI
ncbi:MAG: TSUP family transporter, partial [Segetibacter sp.]